MVGVGVCALKKITQYFLLGKRIGGGVLDVNSDNNNDNNNATQKICGFTKATVDKRGEHNNKDSVCNPALNIVITVDAVWTPCDLWVLQG